MKVKSLLFTTLLCIFSYPVFSLNISSPAFSNNGYIPDKYTCSSLNYSPPLFWNDVPERTKSFALICEDPDAPFGVWVHWIIFNIPENARELKENILKSFSIDNGIRQGINSFGAPGYGGPCPPPGKAHHYLFKLYALDRKLSLKGEVTKKRLLSAMEGHILKEGKLVGLYRR